MGYAQTTKNWNSAEAEWKSFEKGNENILQIKLYSLLMFYSLEKYHK